MRQARSTLEIRTPGRGLTELTPQVARWVAASGIGDGLLTVFVRHTSASLLIQENADPTVQADLERFLARLVPDGDALFEHRSEGADDMPAHVRSALTATQLSIPVADGRPMLGTWQGSTCTSTAAAATCARWCCTCWGTDAAACSDGPAARCAFPANPVNPQASADARDPKRYPCVPGPESSRAPWVPGTGRTRSVASRIDRSSGSGSAATRSTALR